MDKEIDTLLMEIKQATGYSQVCIANLIGISQATVNRILHGQRGCSIPTYKAITLLHKRIFGRPVKAKPLQNKSGTE